MDPTAIFLIAASRLYEKTNRRSFRSIFRFAGDKNPIANQKWASDGNPGDFQTQGLKPLGRPKR